MSEPTMFYIESRKHGPRNGQVVWWGPNHSGYTCDLNDAGLYGEAEAREICRAHPNQPTSVMWQREQIAPLVYASVDHGALLGAKNLYPQPTDK